MPEIWLDYGITNVVLDIKAENLEQNIDSDGKILEDGVIQEKLAVLDLSKPSEIVVLHDSKAVQKVLSTLYMMCEQKSKPFPQIFAEKRVLNQIKHKLPEGSTISEFEDSELSNANLVFLGEMEFDG
ncbi:MAG TPA: transcriptional regulator, partial [Nitrosopumilaceae archaeon]|nr:transcriptional regulator [Nitrosopumilaceae archaeon]